MLRLRVNEAHFTLLIQLVSKIKPEDAIFSEAAWLVWNMSRKTRFSIGKKRDLIADTISLLWHI